MWNFDRFADKGVVGGRGRGSARGGWGCVAACDMRRVAVIHQRRVACVARRLCTHVQASTCARVAALANRDEECGGRGRERHPSHDPPYRIHCRHLARMEAGVT